MWQHSKLQSCKHLPGTNACIEKNDVMFPVCIYKAEKKAIRMKVWKGCHLHTKAWTMQKKEVLSTALCLSPNRVTNHKLSLVRNCWYFPGIQRVDTTDHRRPRPSEACETQSQKSPFCPWAQRTKTQCKSVVRTKKECFWNRSKIGPLMKII